MAPLRRPDDPDLAAELAACRARWLALPLPDRRRHWDVASRQMGMLSGIAGFVEMRAWDLAGIHRWQVRRLLRSGPYVGPAVLRDHGHLLDADPLGPSVAACRLPEGTDGRIGEEAAPIALRAS